MHYEVILIEPIQGHRALTSSICIPVSPFNHSKNPADYHSNMIIPLLYPIVQRIDNSTAAVPTT